MNINFEYYKIFYYVAKNGNITKTAKELMISQPAISKSIKNLEEQLNCSLFNRHKNGVSLTEEGSFLYDEIKSVMKIINSAEKEVEEINNLEKGNLSIGINNTLTQKYLLPYLKEFTKKYPKINIRILTGPPNELIKQAINSLIDIIILHLPYNIPKEFNIINLKEIQDIFVCNNDYDYLKKQKIALKNLNDYPLILLAKGSNGRYYLDNICTNNNVVLNPKFELSSYSLLTEFIKSGMGIGILTKEFIEEELRDNKLFRVNVDIKLPHRYIGAIYLKSKKLNKASQTFLDFLLNKKL